MMFQNNMKFIHMCRTSCKTKTYFGSFQTFKEQCSLLEDIVESVKDNGGTTRCILFLDSIDQLAPDDGAYLMRWLPKKLPPFFKIVVSTLPDEKYNVVNNLKVRQLYVIRTSRNIQSGKLVVILETFQKPTHGIWKKIIYYMFPNHGISFFPVFSLNDTLKTDQSRQSKE